MGVVQEFILEKDQKIEFSIFLTSREGKAVVKLSGGELEEVLIQEDQVYTDGRGTFLEKGIYNITLTSEGCEGEIFIFIKGL